MMKLSLCMLCLAVGSEAWVQSLSPRGLRSGVVVSSDPVPQQPPQPSPDQPQPKPPPPVILPTVTGAGGEQIDVLSRLLKDRILLLGSEVNDEVANVIVAQMLYLANEDPDKDITLYINSPGGSVSAGMAIYDTMQFIPCDVSTVCFGMAASMVRLLFYLSSRGSHRRVPSSSAPALAGSASPCRTRAS